MHAITFNLLDEAWSPFKPIGNACHFVWGARGSNVHTTHAVFCTAHSAIRKLHGWVMVWQARNHIGCQYLKGGVECAYMHCHTRMNQVHSL